MINPCTTRRISLARKGRKEQKMSSIFAIHEHSCYIIFHNASVRGDAMYVFLYTSIAMIFTCILVVRSDYMPSVVYVVCGVVSNQKDKLFSSF